MKIICIGRNYSEHAKELGNAVPEQPVIFLKPETAILKGNQFRLPSFSDDIHYELEVVVKISKEGKDIPKEQAHQHYETLSLGIDFTARDVQSELKAKGLPWELAKAFDGSAVVGQFQSKHEYHLEHLHFSLAKNQITVQDGNTEQMLFSIDDIIAFASRYFTLCEGDLIYTGTPKGVGKVVANDVLEAFLEGEKLLEIKVI